MAVHKELGRHGGEHGVAAEWIGQAVDYLEVVPPRHGGQAIDRKRLWVVVQGYDMAADQVVLAKKAAMSAGPGAVLVALTRLDQSYEPRIVKVDGPR